MRSSSSSPLFEGQTTTRKRRVLVIDDHDAGRKSLARLLEARGYEVVAVNDGASALEALQPPQIYDHILTDLRLPDLDGRDVVLAARQLVPVPGICLITGWDIDPDEVARLGVNGVFLKPLNVQDIVDKLEQITAKNLDPL